MKKYKIFGLIFSLVLLLSACETDVVDPAGIRGVGFAGTITDANPAIFVDGDLDISYVQFTVDVQEGAVYDDAYIVVSYNSVSQRTRIKDVSSFPAEINITAEEAAAALGMSINDVASEDYFVFELELVADGKVTRSNAGLTVRVVCPFDPALAVGSYNAVSAGWAVNGNVTLEADEDDPYTIKVYGLAALDGLDEDQGPLVMHINPLNFEVTAPRAVLATEVWLGYTDLAYQGFGEFNSCTGAYEMSFTITVSAGSYGAYNFTLTRN